MKHVAAAIKANLETHVWISVIVGVLYAFGAYVAVLTDSTWGHYVGLVVGIPLVPYLIAVACWQVASARESEWKNTPRVQ